ncbi:MAG: efflux RND transporter periplasmic adaptor subunit [Phycisphaerales bacterium]|nr:efflux RND transporter periplasmic adaptor subunit [Phycisphaerales bacterium]
MDSNLSTIAAPKSRLFIRLALPAAILLGSVGLLLYTGWLSLTPAHSVSVTPVALRASTPKDGRITSGVTVQAPGWVEPDPYPIYATSLIEGVVREIKVLEGEAVQAGDVVATMFDDEFVIARRRAEAMEQVAIAEFERIEQLLLRKRPLVAHGAVAQGEVNTLETELKAAQGKRLQAGVELEMADLTLARTKILAPVSGVVMTRLASPGAFLGAEGEHGRHVLHLYDPKHLQMRTDVPLVDAALLGVGQPAEIVFDALPNRVFAGKVQRLVHFADIAKNTVQVKVLIVDPEATLKPEMLGRVRIFTGTIGAPTTAEGESAAAESASGAPSGRYTFFAPRTHLRGEGASAEALVVEDLEGDTGIARTRALTLGRNEVDGWVEVVEGLRPGDQLIDLSTDAPKDGERVRINANAQRPPRSLSSETEGSHENH